uniref:Uncharacterized protein n=1 Tax=Hyaloperonospora arabidopsidis (strain Emoy2) TaxID=559515 RepID=M4BYZ9_HYAAE
MALRIILETAQKSESKAVASLLAVTKQSNVSAAAGVVLMQISVYDAMDSLTPAVVESLKALRTWLQVRMRRRRLSCYLKGLPHSRLKQHPSLVSHPARLHFTRNRWLKALISRHDIFPTIRIVMSRYSRMPTSVQRNLGKQRTMRHRLTTDCHCSTVW